MGICRDFEICHFDSPNPTKAPTTWGLNAVQTPWKPCGISQPSPQWEEWGLYIDSCIMQTVQYVTDKCTKVKILFQLEIMAPVHQLLFRVFSSHGSIRLITPTSSKGFQSIVQWKTKDITMVSHVTYWLLCFSASGGSFAVGWGLTTCHNL